MKLCSLLISKTELQCYVSQFLHCYNCERFIYFQDRSTYSCEGKYADGSWEYVNHSQTHGCGNWDWGRAIPRKVIHKWDFRCSVKLVSVGRVENQLSYSMYFVRLRCSCHARSPHSIRSSSVTSCTVTSRSYNRNHISGLNGFTLLLWCMVVSL